MIPEASIQQAFGVPPASTDALAPNDPAYVKALFWEQQVLTVGTTPTIVDLTQNSVLPSNPGYLSGGFSLEIEARDADVFIRCASNNQTPSTTPDNGRRIAVGNPAPSVFWIPGNSFQYLDIVAKSAGSKVVFRRCSQARVVGQSTVGVPNP